MKTLIYWLVAIVFVGCAVEEFKEVDSTQIAKGNLYGNGIEQISKQCAIITSNAEWQQYVTKINLGSEDAPIVTNTNIDFSKNEVIAAFDQVRTGNGYPISVDIVEGNWKVYVKVKYDSTPNLRTSSTHIQPFIVLSIPRTNKEIQVNIVSEQ